MRERPSRVECGRGADGLVSGVALNETGEERGDEATRLPSRSCEH